MTVTAGFPRGKLPEFPMGEKSHWDNTVVNKNKQKSKQFRSSRDEGIHKFTPVGHNTSDVADTLVALCCQLGIYPVVVPYIFRHCDLLGLRIFISNHENLSQLAGALSPVNHRGLHQG